VDVRLGSKGILLKYKRNYSCRVWIEIVLQPVIEKRLIPKGVLVPRTWV
jgi:hypothetical protein